VRWIVGLLAFGCAFAGGFAIGERVAESRAAVPVWLPVPDRIDWQLPEVYPDSCVRYAESSVDDSLPIEERISIWHSKIKELRFWAGAAHDQCRACFDPTEIRATIESMGDPRCSIRVEDADGIDVHWDFLVRHDGIQSQYAVTRIDGTVVEGELRARRILPGGRRDLEGVLLLRPTFQRPIPVRGGLPAPLYESELREHAAALARGRITGTICYPMDPVPGPFGPSGFVREGAVIEVRATTERHTLVILDSGLRSGLQVSHEVKLRRGSKFVGFARIVRVNAHTAVAIFDDETTGSGAPPRGGDAWYTD